MTRYFKAINHKSYYSLKNNEFMISMFSFDGLYLGRTSNKCPYFIGYTNYTKLSTGVIVLICNEKIIEITKEEWNQNWEQFGKDFHNWFYETPEKEK